ncbi:MAG TPA: preprotein translocase subunit SecG [Planctomycetota bacterium]|nr:preprotein translocase subunit SecG [Planctomycetota bacterium]
MLVLLSILFALVCLLLIFMVVITPSQSEGLAGAFGGMGSDTFFGTKAGQHINRFTIGLAVAFLVLAVLINFMATSGGGKKEGMVPGRTETTAPPPGQP